MYQDFFNFLEYDFNQYSIVSLHSALRSEFQKKSNKIQTNSWTSQNFLILLISLGIIIALSYILYHPQINEYFFKTKEYFIQKSDNLVTGKYDLRDKLRFIAKPEKNTQKNLTNNYSASIQFQYYNAVNLLNEGNVDQARKNLKSILQKNPEFFPAKQAISMLNSRLK